MNKIIHKRSSVITDGIPKLPNVDALEYGEIAINYAKDGETISFRNSSDEIVEFRSKKYFEDIITENEETVSTALNNLNSRINGLAKDYVNADGVLKIELEGEIDAAVMNLNNSITNKADAVHNHDDQYYTESEINTKLSGKQDTIADIATIRTNAAKGATALQEIPSEYVTESKLTDYAKLSDVETMINNMIITAINSDY